MDADAWDERYAAAEMVWSTTPNQFVEECCSKLPPGRAVDLAAGEGRNAIWLASTGWQVEAVDFSEVAIARGQHLAGEQSLSGSIEWIVADTTTWRSDPRFDLALISYLQLPNDQRRRVVQAAFAALVPGGTLLLVAHDATNLLEGTGGPQDATVLMSAADILDDLDLADADYQLVFADRVRREVTKADEHGGLANLSAWDCLVQVTRTG